jgi:tetrapyrrole methylase family protein/MazG family protein
VAELQRIIARLRGPDGCPWDREQTPRSMVRYLLEEAYELVDAIESGKEAEVCEELGDVLFHVLFLTALYAETGHFGVEEVGREIAAKMIRRHPHVFGTTRVSGSEEVVRNWQQIKRLEKNGKREPPASALDSVPRTLPALMRALAVSERAGRARFDWQDMEGVLGKLDEEMGELREAVGRQDAAQTGREIGDLLFTLVNVARFAHVHPEAALAGAVNRFEDRFRRMEKTIAVSGRALESVPQGEKDTIWDDVKSKE